MPPLTLVVEIYDYLPIIADFSIISDTEVKYQGQYVGAGDLKGLLEFCRERHVQRGYVITEESAARWARVHKEMQPFLDEAERIKEQVVTLKEQLKALKKDKGGNGAVKALEVQIREK